MNHERQKQKQDKGYRNAFSERDFCVLKQSHKKWTNSLKVSNIFKNTYDYWSNWLRCIQRISDSILKLVMNLKPRGRKKEKSEVSGHVRMTLPKAWKRRPLIEIF